MGDVPEFQADIVSTLQRFKPDAVITFDEDGLYWHLDHIGVHERTSTAVQSLGADAPPLYYVTMPRGAMRALVDAAVASGWVPLDAKVWGITPDAFGLQTEPHTLTLDVGDWVPRKLAAPTFHRRDGDEINDALLGCHCCVFPIVAGIPVMHLDGAAKTAAAYIGAGQPELARRAMFNVEDDAAAARLDTVVSSETATYQ